MPQGAPATQEEVAAMRAELAQTRAALTLLRGGREDGPRVTDVRARPKELLAQLRDGNLYRRAYGEGMSLSAFLEREDRSDGYHDGLDAFERLLQAAEIKTTSDPARGFWADEFSKFDADEYRMLVPEWVARQWRKTTLGRSSTRSLYTSQEAAEGTILQPYIDTAVARYQQLAPAIPLSAVVAITTPINGIDFRAFYLTDDATQERMVRVAEGAELPRAKLSGGEHTIRLTKFGRALEVTYEQLRRQRIDVVALHIARMAIRTEIDKVSAAMDVLVNGDGNSGTAATVYNLTTMDSAATAGTLTLPGWLNFKLQFPPPYVPTTMLAQPAMVLQSMLLNAGSANIPLVMLNSLGAGFGGMRPINPQLADSVAVGWTADAPSEKIILFDSRLAVQQITEIGSDISEIERWATRQTQLITFSEVSGFAIFDQNATKVLDVSA